MSTKATSVGHPHPRESFVITKIQEGYRVYSVRNPAASFIVSGASGGATCTCPEFKLQRRQDPDWRCPHLEAVFGNGNGAMAEPENPRNGSAMLLKRSVSPDGRIDSLSIEFTCPTDGIDRGDLIALAQELLALQSDIADAFLKGTKGDNPPSSPRPAAPAANGRPRPATITGFGILNNRWGRRHFLDIELDGRVVKLFGNEEELAGVISGAGFSDQLQDLQPGLRLSIPCRVTTKPARDPRYLDIIQVLPISGRDDRRVIR